MRKLFPLAALVLVGCYSNPGTNPEPVDVSGKVTLAGKTVSDVFLNLQPTGSGTEARLPVKNGEFKGKLTAGALHLLRHRGLEEACRLPGDSQQVPSRVIGSADRYR